MKQLYMYSDFRAGLNLDSSPDHLAENELVVADNIDLSERGGVKKRYGVDKLNSVSYEKPVTQVFEWPRDNGEIWEMAVIGETLCKLDPATKTSTSISPVSKPKVGFFVFQDNLYYLTGTDFRRYDGVADESVPAKDEETNDLDPIRKCKFAIRHTKSQRMFFAGNPDKQAALYYSEPGDPGFVKETSVMFPSTGDGPITGLALFVDAVLVFFRHSVWVWRGIDPETDAVWHKLPTNEGTIAPDSICHVTTGLMYLGARGIINLSPAIIGMSADIQLGKEAVFNTSANKVEKIIKQITYPSITSAAYDSKNGLYLLAYSDDGQQRNNRILVLDENGCYVRWTDIFANDILYGLNGDLVFASENYLLTPVEGSYQDLLPNGGYKNTTAVIQTPRYFLGSPVHKKVITRYQVMMHGQEGNSVFKVEVLVDDKIVLSDIIDENTSSKLELVKRAFRKLGKRASIRVTNEDGKPFMLYGLGLEAKAVNTYGERV